MLSENDLQHYESSTRPDPTAQNGPKRPNSHETQCHSDANSSHLTDLQIAAINLLLVGKPLSYVAESLGIGRRTLYTWRHQHPAFRSELSRRREDLYGQASDRYRSLLNFALDALEEQVKDKWQPTSHRAAKTLLSLSKLPHHLFPSPPITNNE